MRLIKASEYGILNLKRIIVQLPSWTKEEADTYENLDDMYTQLLGQFSRYMNHVTKNVGGIYETLKSIEETGEVYAPPWVFAINSVEDGLLILFRIFLSKNQ